MRGGKREGAGRKRGSRNRRSEEAYMTARASGALPLDRMLEWMNNDDLPVEFRADMAKAAAPYVHPRLSAVTKTANSVDLSKLTDKQLDRAIELRRELDEILRGAADPESEEDDTRH
jgi:hypothetical protein